MTIKTFALATACSLAALSAPAMAKSDSLEYFSRSHAQALPKLLSQDDQLYYRSLF